MFMKTMKVLRNNWKKSVFFSCVTVWATNYGNNKWIEYNKMSAYCKEAVQFGNEYLSADKKCRHITVLLNPVANGRKSKANYEKFCAPLLHLAGIRVSLVITEAEGQARDLMEVMDNTDAVLIAGGNGTVHESVTGLMRRSDNSSAIYQFPIGILPVGKRNTIAFNLNRITDKNIKNFEVLAESTMSVIKELLKPIDVMKIEGTKGRPVFALGELNFGKIRDTFTSVDKYWYLGKTLKPYLAFISNSFKSLPSVECLNISYSEPCTGCSKCYKRFEVQTAVNPANDKRDETTRWWHIFVSRKTTNSNNYNLNPNQSKPDLKSIINDKCSQWSTLEDINAANVFVKNTNECKLEVIIHSEPLTRNQFISDGVKLFNSQPLAQTTGSSVQLIQAMDINIDLANDSTESANSVVDVEPIDGTEDKISSDDSSADQWFSIDTESYERQSVRITLLPKILNIYSLA